MLDQSSLLTTLSRFAQAINLAYDVEGMLSDLAGSVTDVLGLAGSGVTIAQDGDLVFITAAGPRLEELERSQMQHHAGPCQDAFHTGDTVAVVDLDPYAHRWPEYVKTARRLGIASVAGIPMKLADRCFGALNLYSSERRVWQEDELQAALVLADVATSYLVNGSKVRQLEQFNEQLQHALDARVVIEQAKGIVANRAGIDLEEAFDRIRRHARSHNATVRAVAESVVNLGLHV